VSISTVSVTLRPMTAADWPAVRRIYEEGIATRLATFETEAPDWEKWDTSHRPDCRFVAVYDGEVAGWAALSLVSARHVYRGVAEVSIYIAEFAQGKGVGKYLLQSLIQASEEAGIWTLQAALFPENTASKGLHESCGFRVIGRRERIAQLDGEWRDTIILERRSTIVGI